MTAPASSLARAQVTGWLERMALGAGLPGVRRLLDDRGRAHRHTEER